jgi:hypothetical protein
MQPTIRPGAQYYLELNGTDFAGSGPHRDNSPGNRSLHKQTASRTLPEKLPARRLSRLGEGILLRFGEKESS